MESSRFFQSAVNRKTCVALLTQSITKEPAKRYNAVLWFVRDAFHVGSTADHAERPRN